MRMALGVAAPQDYIQVRTGGLLAEGTRPPKLQYDSCGTVFPFGPTAKVTPCANVLSSCGLEAASDRPKPFCEPAKGWLHKAISDLETTPVMTRRRYRRRRCSTCHIRLAGADASLFGRPTSLHRNTDGYLARVATPTALRRQQQADDVPFLVRHPDSPAQRCPQKSALNQQTSLLSAFVPMTCDNQIARMGTAWPDSRRRPRRRLRPL